MQKDYSTLTDQELWKLIAQDCKPAFLELYERYAGGVFCAARGYILSADDATNLLVTVFNEAWDNRRVLAAGENFEFSIYLYQKIEKAIWERVERLKRAKMVKKDFEKEPTF